MLKKKKTTASGKLVLVKSVRRTRSHRMKFCVQRGLGALPSTSTVSYTHLCLCDCFLSRGMCFLPGENCPQIFQSISFAQTVHAPVSYTHLVGIAMGGLGSDAAIEAADVVLMTDEPSKIAAVMKIARKTVSYTHLDSCCPLPEHRSWMRRRCLRRN